jgi:signal transduction histidine kinase
MRERVEMVGGQFSVVSKPGIGTSVRAEIPFWPARKGAIGPVDGMRADPHIREPAD